ncbi:MAG: tetratricopeptide repeat-containing glycosyltransferase family protein [Phycisphaerae bacterium]|nr:tetratricopeptide repeat-containing glycosyltransferase family protein [Phycisphaerae bacterium]
MSDIAQIMTAAAKHHKDGDLDQATTLYKQVLELCPDHPDALHNLGLMAYEARAWDTALAYLKRAIIAHPRIPEFYNTYGVILAAAGHLDQALLAYAQATTLHPTYTEAYNNMALAFSLQGHHIKAVEHLKLALKHSPDSAVTYYNLANTLCHLASDNEAIDHFQHALRLNPNLVQAHINLANLLQQKSRHAEAIACYKQALRVLPDQPRILHDMGNALKACGDYSEAIAAIRQALSLNGQYAQAWNSLGVAYKESGQCDEAIACYDKAIAIEPDYPDAHWNRTLTLLLKGDLAEGWSRYQVHYEALKTRTSQPKDDHPLWQGDALKGRRILVRFEQGLGDNLQFIRYLPLVRQLGGTVIYQAKPALLPLLEGFQGIDELIEARPDHQIPVPYNFQISLMDLPRVFKTTLTNLPDTVPYLTADPIKVAAWQDTFIHSGMKVGLVWAGSPFHRNDGNRSCPLKALAPLAQAQGVHFYGLQTGSAGQESQTHLSHHFHNIGHRFRDLSDTAAAIAHLDLVISVDTAVLHLAGALGKSVWGLLPYAPDWRWMLHRHDSPWYPTLRLFRQPRPGDWTTVFDQVTHALQTYVRMF